MPELPLLTIIMSQSEPVYSCFKALVLYNITVNPQNGGEYESGRYCCLRIREWPQIPAHRMEIAAIDCESSRVYFTGILSIRR